MTAYSATGPDKNTNQNCDTKQNVPNIAIIGGGLTGLFTAILLERAFAQQESKASLPQITVFERSHSVGLLATRYRIDKQTDRNWQWAFGAQFLPLRRTASSSLSCRG